MENHQEKLFDLSNLEEISGGSKDFIRQMLEMFIDQADKTISGFKEGIASNNFSLIRDLAHQIKPSIDNIKIEGLIPAIREVEYQAENEAPADALSSLILDVNRQLELVIYQLKLELDGM